MISADEFGDSCITVYMDEDGDMLMLEVSLADSHAVDNENREYYSEYYNGIEYHVYESIDIERVSSVIVWTQESFSFSMSGEIAIAELIRVAVSVKWGASRLTELHGVDRYV